MVKLRFQAWYHRAVSQIIYIPDRIAVERELKDHMEDCYAHLLAQGFSPEEAEVRTVAAMGDADEVARQLAAVHRPFWGLFQQRSRKVLIVLMVLAAVCFGGHLLDRYALANGYDSPRHSNFDPYTATRYIDDAGRYNRLFRSEPDTAVSSDGYTITLTDVALWRHTYENIYGTVQEEETLYFQLEFFNPRPWAVHDDVSRWFWAMDDLGNYYSAFCGMEDLTSPAVCSTAYHTAPGTYVHDMYLSNFVSQDAQWIDLHYDRAGRDITHRIDLTGGDA